MELHLQKHLRNGGTLEDLSQELGLRIHHHPDSETPLVGFTYHQIDSPKTHEIVRESRGITLEKGSWNLVAKAFNRFFNLGEVADEYKTFNWDNFDCYTKADGSLMLMFHYGGRWQVKTRGSFGDGIVQNPLQTYAPSFAELFWDIKKGFDLDPNGKDSHLFDPDCTYVFEMCSKYNKVVRTYEQPTTYLLTIVDNKTAKEYPHDESDAIATKIGLPRVGRHHFSSLDEIKEYIQHLEDTDPTNEGVIVCDDKWLRYKIKSKTYTAFHHLLDNGNLYNPKRLVPWVLCDDPSELLLHFPEVTEHYEQVRDRVTEAYDSLVTLWEETHTIEDQKSFALAIKGRSPFMGLLFQLRKQTGIISDKGVAPGPQTEQQLRELWRNNPEGIVKTLF